MYLYNSLIDYTLLEDTSEIQLQQLCEKAKKYNVASVCIYPKYVAFIKEQLTGTNIRVCTVISFPEGK